MNQSPQLRRRGAATDFVRVLWEYYRFPFDAEIMAITHLKIQPLKPSTPLVIPSPLKRLA